MKITKMMKIMMNENDENDECGKEESQTHLGVFEFGFVFCGGFFSFGSFSDLMENERKITLQFNFKCNLYLKLDYVNRAGM